MTVGKLCTRDVHTISRLDSVGSAARRMLEHHVGSLVVVDQSRKPDGMVTDRDIVVRCVARDFNPETTPVGDIMTESLETIRYDADIEEALWRMSREEIRRLVVLGEGGGLYGLLSLDDVLSRLVHDAEEVGRLLKGQVHA